MLEFKFLWNAFKYYMRLLSSLVLMALAGLIIVPMSYASAITLQNAVEGELYTESTSRAVLSMNTYFEASLIDSWTVCDSRRSAYPAHDARYPNTICEVVLYIHESWKTKQHADPRPNNPVRNMCQFSWYCDGKADKVRDGDAWRKAQEIAYRIVTEGKFRGVTEGATHYHATYVSPDWAPQLDLVGRIGTHIFYRWP